MSVFAAGQTKSGLTKLCGIAVAAIVAAVASFHGDIAVALGVTALVVAGFTAVAILVGAAVATRQSRAAAENGRAPALDGTPVISPLQEQ